MMSAKKAIVIGSGFAGLSAACYLAKGGFEVTILEKNSQQGGRARNFSAQGFTFDMGPSWYWMPDVFEKFYHDFGHTTNDFYKLIRLDPSYRVIAKNGEAVDIPADMTELENLFERFEPGSSIRLKKFLKEAAYKYDIGINELVYKPGLSLFEFADIRLLSGLLRMDVITSMRKHIGKVVSNPFLTELLEFPLLFLGALPENTPALYSLMNYADMQLGTWYPQGGMFKVIEAFTKISGELGVQLVLNQEVKHIHTKNGKAISVQTKDGIYEADVFVGTADYHHIDQMLLDPENRAYSEAYWDKRKMAPSCLLYFVGIDKRIQNLKHHNLFFDADFNLHSKEIYTTPKWPGDPLFYLSVPSKTDPGVAPEGCENLSLLIPISPGLEGDTENIRDYYLNMLLDRLEKHTGEKIKESVIYKRSYCLSDFKEDYHAFKGNAYGLANTLKQTAIFKPGIKSKKVGNLFYAGQLTVPGPGVPPCIISGKVTASQIIKEYENKI